MRKGDQGWSPYSMLTIGFLQHYRLYVMLQIKYKNKHGKELLS